MEVTTTQGIPRRGRPRGEASSSQVRKQLLRAAQELFTEDDYAKVSTRRVAELAGSNIGMIRYYFGNKAGLFEAVCSEYCAPVTQGVITSLAKAQGLVEILEAYYLNMARTPRLPRLVHRVMSMAESEEQRQILSRVMLQSGCDAAFERVLAIPGVLKPGVDPKLTKFSLISVLVFPFLMPDGVRDRNNIQLNEPFLRQLARHNATLLSQGILSENNQV